MRLTFSHLASRSGGNPRAPQAPLDPFEPLLADPLILFLALGRFDLGTRGRPRSSRSDGIAVRNRHAT